MLFFECPKLTYISIPSSVVYIGAYAFGCSEDTSRFLSRNIFIRYDGTKSQWNSVKKSQNWMSSTDNTLLPYKISFSDSDIS